MKKIAALLSAVVAILLAAGAAEKVEPTPWLEQPALAADAAEQRILDVLSDLAGEQEQSSLNVSPDEGRFLRLLTEATDARHVVEIGTSHGYSGLWFSLALRRTRGRLTTHEIDATRIKVAGDHFQRAGVDDLVTIVKGDAHDTVARVEGPIDILFLDADKDGNADYLEQLRDRIRPGGLIIAHSAADQSDRMQDYLNAVTTDPKLETQFFHMDKKGLAVTLNKRMTR